MFSRLIASHSFGPNLRQMAVYAKPGDVAHSVNLALTLQTHMATLKCQNDLVTLPLVYHAQEGFAHQVAFEVVAE